ncbi:unnamed protein product [Orchesella dallaii]|uniref:Uncharacterized protein n=1 Tax=Orchesella dallaii TaxID=48710 RepID=A0ABP1S8R6_9HEXA
MSTLIRGFFHWACCGRLKPQNAATNDLVVNNGVEMKEFKRSDILREPKQQDRPSTSSAGESSKFKTWSLRHTGILGLRPHATQYYLYRPGGGRMDGRSHPLSPMLAKP